MKPTPAWFSEIIALATKCARRAELDHLPGRPEGVWVSTVMGYDVEPMDDYRRADTSGPPLEWKSGEFWAARVYPANNEETAFYHLDRWLKIVDPGPTILVVWNHIDVEGKYKGHEFRITFYCNTPPPPRLKGATVERLFEGVPYVEPPMPSMGPDFGDD
jgi:hypothetical protein